MEPNNLKKEPIYFSMNVPDWYMNLSSLDDKCKIIEDLAEELKNEPPITEEQMKELITL